MKRDYPIDIEDYARKVCAECGDRADVAEFAKLFASTLNSAYHAGKTGKPGYPLDPETKLAEGCRNLDVSVVDPTVRNVFFNAVRLINKAYYEGVQDAQTEVA